MIKYREIHFEISSECVLRCKHCSTYMSDTKTIEYSIEDINVLISSFDDIIDVYLTGGEPLLNFELKNIIQNIKKCKNVRNIGLFTTGQTLINGCISPIPIEYAQELIETGLSTCYISVYNSKSDLHDYLTNIDGSFKNTIAAISNLKTVGVDVKFNVVAFKQNIPRLQSIVELAQKFNISEVRFLKLVRHGGAKDEWNEIGITKKEFEDCIKCFLDNVNNTPIITASSVPLLLPCRPIDNAEKCQAGTNLIYVDRVGNAFPCASVKNNYSYLLGNIKDAGKILTCLKYNYKTQRNCCLSGEINMNIKDFVDSVYIKNLYSEYNNYNEEMICSGITKTKLELDKLGTPLLNDFIEFYLSVYKLSKSKSIFNQKEVLEIIKSQNGDLICFIAQKADYNIIKTVGETQINNINLVIYTRENLSKVVNDYIIHKLQLEYDILNYKPNELNKILNILNA